MLHVDSALFASLREAALANPVARAGGTLSPSQLRILPDVDRGVEIRAGLSVNK